MSVRLAMTLYDVVWLETSRHCGCAARPASYSPSLMHFVFLNGRSTTARARQVWAMCLTAHCFAIVARPPRRTYF